MSHNYMYHFLLSYFRLYVSSYCISVTYEFCNINSIIESFIPKLIKFFSQLESMNNFIGATQFFSAFYVDSAFQNESKTVELYTLPL